jgi:hypothetical protein
LPPSTFRIQNKLAAKYKPLPLEEERRLIRRAKKGSLPAREKLLLHLIGFFIFRMETTLFPPVRHKFGEDILQECILFAETKINSYNLRYKDKEGLFKKVCFRTYLWKGVTGVMLKYLKQNGNPAGPLKRQDA